MLKTVKNTLSGLLVIAVIFAAGFGVGRLPHGGEVVEAKGGTGIDLKLPGEVEKTVVTVDEVEAKLFEIGEFSFYEADYSVKKGRDFTRYVLDDIAIPGTTNHVELTCSGVVKVGYDIKDVGVKVDDDSRKIYISLPQIEVNSNQLIWDESMEWREGNNILNPIDFSEYQGLIEEIKAEGLKKAEKEDLYKNAEENAKKVITNFLGCFGEYEVVYM